MLYPTLIPLLAAAAPDSPQNVQSLVRWGVVALGGCFVLVIGLAVLRRVAKAWKQSPIETGFTIHELRKLRESGRLTPEEYELARNRVIDRARHGISTRTPRTPPGIPGTPGSKSPDLGSAEPQNPSESSDGPELPDTGQQ